MKHCGTLCLLIIFGIISDASGQGCVAIRSQSCSGNFVTGSNQSAVLGSGDLMASMGYRFFRSFRHFRGSEEEANRVAEGTEVINHFNGIDLGLTYGLTDRLSFTLIAPFMMNDRSSLYEHYGNRIEDNPEQKRFHTQSAGLGDVRLTGSYWLFDHSNKGNLAIGGTIKFPTGKSDVTDEFHKLDENKMDYLLTQAVDQSIQLGDDAFGFGLELNGFQTLGNKLSMYYSASYLATPKNVNNTLRRANADPENVYSYFSCPDQYAARAGILSSPLPNLTVALGGRIEGVPSSDLFGESEGFRRPGYAISVEPGVSLLLNRFAVSLNVPVALVRNRTQNTLDKINDSHGDAAFADFVINATVTYLISNGHKDMMIHPIEDAH
jgi:hypothetical protein